LGGDKRSYSTLFARLFDNDEIYARIGIVYSQSREKVFSKEEAVRLILKYKNRLLEKSAERKAETIRIVV
jgi:hypothetical protein